MTNGSSPKDEKKTQDAKDRPADSSDKKKDK